MPAAPRASAAALAAMYDLRKDNSSGMTFRSLDRAATRSPTARHVNNTSTAQRVRFYHRGFMRADTPSISAPPFPRDVPWVNVSMLRMDQQRGKVVLVEFWDFCRVNSLRTLPYLRTWHSRYEDDGLRVIGVHTGAFPPSRDDALVRDAVARVEIPWAVAIDTQLQIWDLYGNEGWPARYLWDPDLSLHSLHYGEGAYAETEREIQTLLGVSGELVEPLRPEDAPDAMIATPTPDVAGPYSGEYQAG